MLSKKMKVLALTGVIMFTGFAGTATAQENNKKENKTEIEYGIGDAYLEEGDFEDFIGEPTTCVIGIEDMKLEELYPGIEKVMGKEDVAKAKKIFEDIKNLEKDGKFEESSKLWDNLEKIVKKYDDSLRAEEAKNMKFEDYIMGIKDGASKEDKAKAEKLFNESKALLVDGKIDEGYNKLDEMYKLIDKYYGANDIIVEPGFGIDMKFEDFYGDMNKYMSKDDLSKAKKLFEDFKKLEKEGKYQESSKIWDEIEKTMAKYEDKMNKEQAKNMKFEDYIMFSKDEMKKEDLTKAEKIFNEAKALLVEGKLEDGKKKLYEFYEITDKYIVNFDFKNDLDVNENENVIYEIKTQESKSSQKQSNGLNKNEKNHMEETKKDYYENLKLDDILKVVDKEISKEDRANLQKIFDDIKMVKESKSEYNKLWEKFYSILEKYMTKTDMKNAMEKM